MKLTHRILLALLLANLWSSNESQAEDKEPLISLATAPGGSFELICKQIGASPVWLVPKAAPNHRTALPPVRFQAVSEGTTQLRETSSDEFEGLQLTFISPDENWIYVQMTLEEEESYAVGWLYQKAESSTPQEPRYELSGEGRLDTLAWRLLCKEEHIPEKEIGVPDQFGHKRMSIAFAAWGPDSGRLLFSLSGGIGARKEPMGEFPRSVGPWFCYFNTKTKTFERTERLRAASAGKSGELLTAESIGQEGPEIPAEQRFKKADAALNSVYAALLKTLAPEANARLRQEQREWLKERDLFAVIHANQSWSQFPGASNAEGRAIATERRVAELQSRIGASGAH
ncbi:MAG: Lysozyme inhibitor LprI [Chthoniobacter sp.]|jgi:uncharacterized protein YecT (DUF1311 family)|nr:Lysozyme inhibitor LprI [Chthoniobacter sp.]